MLIEETGIPGLRLITPPRFGDVRGFFAETYSREKLAAQGVALEFVQDNHSLSAQMGTVRGLHFQAPPRAQAKLVRCGGAFCSMWRSISDAARPHMATGSGSS